MRMLEICTSISQSSFTIHLQNFKVSTFESFRHLKNKQECLCFYMYFRKNPVPKTNTKRIRPIIHFRSQKPKYFRAPNWKDPFLLGIGPKISEQGPVETEDPPVERPAGLFGSKRKVVCPSWYLHYFGIL